jgi:ThiF family
MDACRVVSIGTGGAATFCEDFAHAGVGEQVLIDPDTVAEPNLATQRVYRRDIGRPKVDSIAERIRDINPNARVIARQASRDDLSDAAFEHLAKEPIGHSRRKPATTLIGGFTDSFAAQARVNRLALQSGWPSLCAQVYREGRGAEITFTVPGVTPACHRCILRCRYEAYLEEEFQNDVTSVRH